MSKINTNMEALTIIKKLTFTQYVESDYPKALAAGYENQIVPTHNSWAKYGPEVYVVEADKNLNFGKDFKILFRYKADGINFLKELSYTCSSLSSDGLRRVNCLQFEMTKEFLQKSIELGLIDEEESKKITFENDVYDTCESNRRIFRKMDFATFY